MKLSREEWIDCAENPELDEFNEDDERKKPMYGGDKDKEQGSKKAVVTIEFEVEVDKLKQVIKAAVSGGKDDDDDDDKEPR